MRKNATLAVIMTVICINAVASAQNVLVNGDFEIQSTTDLRQ